MGRARAHAPVCISWLPWNCSAKDTRSTPTLSLYPRDHPCKPACAPRRCSRPRAVCGAAAEEAVAPTAAGNSGNAQPEVSTKSLAQADVDLTKVALPTSDQSEELLRIRHSCAHLMAMAMQRVHKGVQVTIGPWTENGFYYDFDMSGADDFTEKELKKVRKEMRRLMRKNLPFVREEVTESEARRRITELGEPYKLEILDSIVERWASGLCLGAAESTL
jgi:threonyl-tRNA synthetase